MRMKTYKEPIRLHTPTNLPAHTHRKRTSVLIRASRQDAVKQDAITPPTQFM